MCKYDGRRVVIAGGGSGVGLATAQLLVAGGARVLLTGRTQATPDAAVGGLGDRRRRHEPMRRPWRAALAAFLAFEATCTTGSELFVDGGTAHL